MRALSVRQPWAWLILFGGKDIENRTWRNARVGHTLIHAAKGMTLLEYEQASEFAADVAPNVVLPALKDLPRGGVVGSVTIVGCVGRSASRWFVGPYGFELEDARPLPFVPYRGELGFFEIPDAVMVAAP